MKRTTHCLCAIAILTAVFCAGGAVERKHNISSTDAKRSLSEVAGFQQFPEDYRLARMGSIQVGETYYHIFTVWMKDQQKWRTLVYDNSGSYLGYYQTIDEPVELERTGIIYPGPSYSAEFGDEEEGQFDSGDAHIINFSATGPPDEVKFPQRTYTFTSSPQRVRPDAPGYRFIVVAQRMVNFMNGGRYKRIRDDFSGRARAKLSEEATQNAFANLRMRLGKVERLDAPWVQSADTAVFPITFEREVLGLKLTLDPKDRIAGLWILPYETAFPDIGRHQTALTLPYGGRWRVMWGGNTRDASKYFGDRCRRHSREFVIADRYGNTHLEEGHKNQDYFAFGRPVFAPAAGVVVDVVDGMEDNRPGSPNPFATLGNAVAIQHATNEVSVIGHLMKESIRVKIGDKVDARQLIARCGNSGDSTQPSIYCHLQDSVEALGGSGYLPVFRNVLIWNRGRAHMDPEHVPMRGEYVEQHVVPLEE